MVARDLDHLETLFRTGLKMVSRLEGTEQQVITRYSVGPVGHHGLNSFVFSCG